MYLEEVWIKWREIWNKQWEESTSWEGWAIGKPMESIGDRPLHEQNISYGVSVFRHRLSKKYVSQLQWGNCDVGRTDICSFGKTSRISHVHIGICYTKAGTQNLESQGSTLNLKLRYGIFSDCSWKGKQDFSHLPRLNVFSFTCSL